MSIVFSFVFHGEETGSQDKRKLGLASISGSPLRLLALMGACGEEDTDRVRRRGSARDLANFC